MSSPIFILEGPDGICETYQDKDGAYQLYFEANDGYKPLLVGTFYQTTVSGLFEYAKYYTGLSNWFIKWEWADDWYVFIHLIRKKYGLHRE